MCSNDDYDADVTSSSDVEDEVIDDKKKDPDYDPKPRKRLKAVKNNLRRQIPLDKCKKPEEYRNHPSSSSSDDESVPPLPPRADRTQRSSVLVISSKAKPDQDQNV